MKEILAVVASIIAIFGNIPYLKDVISKRVQPHPYTWFVWTLVSAIAFFGQLAKGAGIGALPTASAELFTVIIFFFSLRYGFKHINRTDTYFLIIALLSLIPWILTKDPTFSVVIVVGIDLIAFIPTLRKTWLIPHSETPTLYRMNVLRHILTLFSLQAYNIATTIHSIAMIITNTLMTSIITLKKPKKI
ncbi:MAG: hypothetical protein RLZZ347_222 [Candidatus Parcubacteria bacterium]|jgi:hypothetical protein